MLYVTTRIQGDAFTAHRSLTENRGPNGGLYVPMRDPAFTAEQIRALGEKSFGENVAEVMNLLFNTDLDGWAVEFSIGRYPVRTVELSGGVTVAEVWHNPDWQFDRLARNLYKAVTKTEEERESTDWMLIAARIAVLFGIYGELLHSGRIQKDALLDIAVPGGDFSAPIAAWYARQWGLPIGEIIICCNENSGPWSLVHQGQLRTDSVSVRTKLPKCDHAVPPDLERLIYGALGPGEAKRYCDTCRVGGAYELAPHQQLALRRGIHVSVVSGSRTGSMITGIYRSDGYIPEPYTALAYSGLIDHRSRTGQLRQALILSEESPAFSLGMVSACLGISQKELKERINRS